MGKKRDDLIEILVEYLLLFTGNVPRSALL